MVVTSAAYNGYGLILAVIDDVAMTVPDDVDNIERQAIAEWENAGNTISPAPPPEVLLPSFVRAGDLWDRVTDQEAEQIEAAIAQQPVRIQNIFRTRNEYHMDHELWPLLRSLAVQLFGADRADQILAPSE